jgi:hypothetical protein
LGTILSQHADERGVGIFDAAEELGGWEGDKHLRGAQAYGTALDTIGPEQITHSQANKILNEAARFEQTYQFAESLGYAGNRDDFQGMYKGHLSHHAQETWTLQDKATVDRLNEHMEAQGLKTRFSTGDRVGMARTEDGSISLAKGRAGATREEIDMTKLVEGQEKRVVDLRTEEKGNLQKFWDDRHEYSSGVVTFYSPARTAAFNAFRATYEALGYDNEFASNSAQQAVASGWGSIDEGRFLGRVVTDPRALLGATVLQGVDIGNRVISEGPEPLEGFKSLLKNSSKGEVDIDIENTTKRIDDEIFNSSLGIP